MESPHKKAKIESTFVSECFELVSSIIVRQQLLELEELASLELVCKGIAEQIQPQDWLDAVNLLLDGDVTAYNEMVAQGHRAGHDRHIYCSDAAIWDHEVRTSFQKELT